MAGPRELVKRGRPLDEEYDKLARKIEKLDVGRWMTLRKCADEAAALRARDTVARSIRKRVSMPSGLALSFRRTLGHSVIVEVVAA